MTSAPTAETYAPRLKARYESEIRPRLHEELGGYTILPEFAPALRELIPALRALEQPPTADGAPERARFELFDRVALALGEAARAAPFVIVIDDLHWSDSGSLLLLESLAPALAGMPLLVLATLRDTEVQPSAERASLVASALRSARRIPLAGLARDEVAELLADPDRVVAAAVERLGVEAAKVSNTGQRD